MAIDVVSWNIQKGIGVDFRRDLARTARVLAACKADVIGLQEVMRTGEADQAQLLADALGMSLAWGPARNLRSSRSAGAGSFGNAVLVRGSVMSEVVHDLSVPHQERRVCLEALVAVGGEDQQVRVFVCHFGLGPRERRRQAEALTEILRAAPKDTPRIVLGDFNEFATKRGPVTRALAAEFPHAPTPVATHPSPWPVFALDRMAWDRPLRGTVRVGTVQRASDHRLLHATLAIPSVAS